MTDELTIEPSMSTESFAKELREVGDAFYAAADALEEVNE